MIIPREKEKDERIDAYRILNNDDGVQIMLGTEDESWAA
jgi:hypothetical protein